MTLCAPGVFAVPGSNSDRFNNLCRSRHEQLPTHEVPISSRGNGWEWGGPICCLLSATGCFLRSLVMAKAEIHSGICGFVTTVEATADAEERYKVHLSISSSCKACQRLAQQLTEVDALREMTFRGEGPLTHELGAKYLTHAACPVTAGIIKAVEVAAGLALPKDATIKVSKE
jgi:hypothetical protein